MSPKTLIRPAVHAMEMPAHGVTPNSSAIIGVTLVGDLEDVMAVLQTGALLARNLRATLSVEVPGEDVFPVYLDQASGPIVLSGLLDSVKAQLCKLGPARTARLAVEVTLTAASLVSEGVISIRVHSANTGLEKSATR